jgi:SAM-dependent methyltransferase
MTRGLGAIDSPAAADPAAFYARGYAGADDRFARWRALGARGKAAHVAALLARAGLRPRTLVEIGCGDGSLLAALSARGVAGALDGFELSAEAAALARDRSIPRVRRVEAYDGAHVPAGDGAYDVSLLSHVVEHVPEPVPLLREAGRVAAHVIVEVPLEANRSAARPAKRAEAGRIGHLHAFDRDGIRALCAAAGLTVLAELTDPLPLAHHAFFASGARAHATAAAKTAARRWLFRAAPRRAERLFTVHYACLASSVGGLSVP